MTKEGYLDIFETLLSQKGRDLMGSNLRSKFFRQKLVFQSFFRGEAPLKEVIGHLRKILWNNSPSFLRLSKKPTILKGDADLIGKLALKYLFNNYPLDPVKLLDRKWHYLPSDEVSIGEKYLRFLSMADMAKQTVAIDQYCAREFIKDNAIVIDVGANIGVFSLFAHSLAPNGKIYSFEPSSQVFHILQRNVLDNDLGYKILLFQEAIGENKKEVKLFSQNQGTSNSIIKDSDLVKDRERFLSDSESVPMTSIDCFVEENKIEHVSFIKMDIEGYEKQAIKGAENTIKKFSPTIACSAYHLKDDKTKIPSLIKSINPNYKHRLEKRAEEVLIFWVNK